MSVTFYERQRPNSDNYIILIFLILGNIILLSISLMSIVILLPFDIMMIVLLRLMSFEISITDNIIRYKFFPYHFNWRVLELKYCSEIEIIEYNAIGDFQGTGRRHLIYKNEKAYITDDNGMALKLKYINNTVIILGIRNHEELLKLLPNLKTIANMHS